MLSDNVNVFTKENLDTYLRELAKGFKKINGKSMPAEIILIGDAAILVNYEQVYASICDEEKHSKDILIGFEQDYPGVANESNINDILKSLKKKK